MENEYALAPLLFVILALLVGAFLKLVLRKSRFPYTVGLFCVGLLVGIVYREGIFPDLSLAARAVDMVGNVNPDMILYIFLPVLIFSAAYEIDLHTFRKTLFNSTVLAVPGVIISMFLVAATMMAISSFVPEFSGWNWTFALMFGALVSATDPVAVVALLKELGTSKKFSTLVDAESLLNDGTGIVLFMLFFGAFSGSSPICSSPFAEFMVVALGGAVLGYLVAVLCIFLISKFRSDELVQNSVIILSAYVTFILAQAYLHLSGVIALVAFGLEMTYHGKIRFSPKANEFTEKFWDLAAFIANTLIFIIVGIIISVQVKITWVSLAVTVGIYLAVNLIRTAVIFLFYPLMKRVGYGLTVRDAIILSWGGLRGALGLSLAMMVSCTLSIPVDIRNQVLLMTAGVVTLTLTVNATTIRRLLARLGLTEIPVAQSFVDYNIRKRVSDSSQKYFDRLR
ncbi:MAG: sodium:proton antiporter, partial [Candidatus Cryptobacteroides sp.]|nr:sodium:proton antiporter [Candidatus Cryptobacteroides sp.]